MSFLSCHQQKLTDSAGGRIPCCKTLLGFVLVLMFGSGGSHLTLLCFTWTLSPSPSPSPSPIPTPALRAAPKPKPELFLGLWLFCPFSLLSLKVISETFWECLGRQSCFHCLHKGQGRVWHFCERLVHAEPLSGTEEAGCVCCEKDNYSSAAGSSVPRIRAHIAQLRADTDI